MESVVAWSRFSVEPYGIDFAPGLVELARTRLPRWADRIWQADVRSWEPPFVFDFVHSRVELGSFDKVVRLGRRAIFSSDGSFRRPESPRAEWVAERRRERGFDVAGEVYGRSDGHLIEISVAWVDWD